MEAIKVQVDGAGVTSSASSQLIAIPNDSSGNRARKVIVSVQGLTYIMPGDSSATATGNSIIMSESSPMVFDVNGLTHIAVLQLTAAQRVNVVPVE
jgi:hypothetical protein